MKLCAHLGFQFTEYKGLERLEQAAKAGFQAVEWPSIYEFNLNQLVERSQALGLKWAQVSLPMGDQTKGEKGLTALPSRVVEYQFALEQAIQYAKALEAPFIHPMAGVGVSLQDSKTMDSYLRNLRLAVDAAKRNGVKVLIEVISEATVPGYAMCTYDLAAQVRDALPDIYLLLDSYHAHNLVGDPAPLVKQWVGRIGHVQIADVPGRNEPGTGVFDFKKFFELLQKAGYEEWVGCEYKPLGHTLDGLSHLNAIRSFL